MPLRPVAVAELDELLAARLRLVGHDLLPPAGRLKVTRDLRLRSWQGTLGRLADGNLTAGIVLARTALRPAGSGAVTPSPLTPPTLPLLRAALPPRPSRCWRRWCGLDPWRGAAGSHPGAARRPRSRRPAPARGDGAGGVRGHGGALRGAPGGGAAGAGRAGGGQASTRRWRHEGARWMAAPSRSVAAAPKIRPPPRSGHRRSAGSLLGDELLTLAIAGLVVAIAR
ncbi:MAG: hypothetical protein R3F60_27450 [bacterium]